VYAPFDGKDQFTTAAVEQYERAVEEAGRNGIKVKALILSNPHNPLGTSSICHGGKAGLTCLSRPVLSP
jgi:bifunctional pyridoxal-dependent enzyme with beta-cystathionase and maltose regulon repressor activities